MIKKIFLFSWPFSPSLRFPFFATVFGISFALSALLITLGLMDSFVLELERGLRNEVGDITFSSTYKTFSEEKITQLDQIKREELREFSLRPLFKIPAVVFSSQAEQKGNMGIMVVGDPTIQGIVIGEKLGEHFHFKIGDSFFIGLSRGGAINLNFPLIKKLKITQISSFKLHETSLRIVFVNLGLLQKIVGMEKQVNSWRLDYLGDLKKEELRKFLESKVEVWQSSSLFLESLEPSFFWSSFSTLLSSIKSQKVMMGLILQVIILMAMLNTLAFLVFLKSQKSKELFLFFCLGLSWKELYRSLLGLLAILWPLACFFSLLFLIIFEKIWPIISPLNKATGIYFLENLGFHLPWKLWGLSFVVGAIWPLFTAILVFWSWNTSQKNLRHLLQESV